MPKSNFLFIMLNFFSDHSSIRKTFDISDLQNKIMPVFCLTSLKEIFYEIFTSFEEIDVNFHLNRFLLIFNGF